MEIRILGCSGAHIPGFLPSSFLLNDTVLVDAGAVAAVLSLEEQSAIDYVFVTHPHLDHVHDIMFLADNVMFRRNRPVKVISTKEVIHHLKKHLFNDVIWPDFSRIPDADNPVIDFTPIEKGVRTAFSDYFVTAVEVSHTVDTLAFLIEHDGGTVLFVGDTGPTEEVWHEANRQQALKAIFVETSFPSGMAAVANAAGHLTPASLENELLKMNHSSVPVYLYHLKPQHRSEIEREIAVLGNDRISILNDGDVVRLK